jgi:uncharacterized metal-binding protein YceD (DUF177 family)
MSIPLVPLENVPSHGMTVPVGPWADARAADAMEGPVRSLAGTLEITRDGRDLRVTGVINATAEVPCDRCGIPVVLPVHSDVDCLYAAPRAEGEALPEDGAEDIGDYDGVALDLAHVVGETLALDRPARVRCADVDAHADDACLARWRAAAGPSAPKGDPRFDVLARFSTSH